MATFHPSAGGYPSAQMTSPTAAQMIGGPNIYTPVRGTENIRLAGQLPTSKYDVSERVYALYPDETPFTVLTESGAGGKYMGKLSGFDTTHRWFEKKPVPQTDTIAGSTAVGAVVISVTNAKKFQLQDTVFIRKISVGHANTANGIVTAVDTTLNTVTIGWIDAPAGALVAGDVLVRIGSAYAQDSQPYDKPTTLAIEFSNKFQIMRHAIAASDLNVSGKYIVNPGDYETEKKEMIAEHMMCKEKTLIFQTQSLDTAFSVPGPDAVHTGVVGTCDGLYTRCTTNRSIVNGVLSRAIVEDFLHGMLAKWVRGGKARWVLFVSSRIWAQIGAFGYTEHRLNDKTEVTFGMTVVKYNYLGQDISIKLHPMFDREGWDDLAILVQLDGENLSYVYHTRWDTALHNVPQTRNRTVEETEMRSVFTLECKGEEINYAVLEGVQAA